jgi:hypothetical protein
MTVMRRVFGALAAALGLLLSAPRPTAARPCAPQPWDTRIGQTLTVTPLAGGDLLLLFGISHLPGTAKRPFASARYEPASGCFRPMKHTPLVVGYGQAAIAGRQPLRAVRGSRPGARPHASQPRDRQHPVTA